MSKVKPAIPILLDKERHLLLDLNAMVAFEEATGESLFKGIDPEHMGAKELRALLWACLLHEDEKLTLKQVGSWINTGNMAEIAQHINDAFQAAMPEAEGKKEKVPLASPLDG